LVLAALSEDLTPVRVLRPDCPPELERIVLKAMSRARSERYATPAEMQADLDALALSERMPRGQDAWDDYSWLPSELRYVGQPEPRNSLAHGQPRQFASVKAEIEALGPALAAKKRGRPETTRPSGRGRLVAVG